MNKKIAIIGVNDYSIALSCVLYALDNNIIVLGHNKKVIAALKLDNYIMSEPNVNGLLKLADVRFTTFACDAYKDADIIAFVYKSIGREELLKWAREALSFINKETIFAFEGIDNIKESKIVNDILKESKYKIHYLYVENTYHKNNIVLDIVQPHDLLIGYYNKNDINVAKKMLGMQLKNGTELNFVNLDKC